MHLCRHDCSGHAARPAIHLQRTDDGILPLHGMCRGQHAPRGLLAQNQRPALLARSAAAAGSADPSLNLEQVGWVGLPMCELEGPQPGTDWHQSWGCREQVTEQGGLNREGAVAGDGMLSGQRRRFTVMALRRSRPNSSAVAQRSHDTCLINDHGPGGLNKCSRGVEHHVAHATKSAACKWGLLAVYTASKF